MTSSVSIGWVKAMLSKVPLMGKTALYHTLGLSETSQEWDLRTALVVNIIRSFVVDGPPESISRVQRLSIHDPGIKGRIWISKATLPVPKEDDVRQALFKTIDRLKDSGEASGGYLEPQLLPVEAEWTGYRADATPSSLLPDISEEEKYKEMMREVSSPATVLYLHGGALYLMDPATHRPTTKKLAKLTKGRCLSVRYRLAPQNPFPSALLDALVSYLNLLYPPPGSFHTAVEPRHIVFGGDSAGGNLCLALLQTILELQRPGLKILWYGAERDVPIPAGLALSSPWADVTHSSPSCEINSVYDYLPPQSMQTEKMKLPSCALWPANPPRKHLYAEDNMLYHPLVSPQVTQSWVGSCPIFIATGSELLTDEDKYLAMRMASQGVPVVFEEYVAMPHCFAMIMRALPASTRYFTSWATFIQEAIANPEEVKTRGVLIQPKTLKEEPLEVTSLLPWTHEEVLSRVRERAHKLSREFPISKL
jgi:acetyl esterase/lipase